jgi:uncharacterized protein (TIGR03083 family)
MDGFAPTDGAECYRTVRGRMTEVAAALTDAQANIKVPALPAWTVRDTYAHLAGLCSEVLDGTLTGRATDEDTARQVEARTDRNMAELCAEWNNAMPQIDERLAGPQGHRYNLMVQDAWHHEQDVLGALGLAQQREDTTARTTARILADLYAYGWTKRSVSPSVRIRTASGEWLLGVGDPIAQLDTDDFELARILIGRRTLEEIGDAGWTGDPSGVLDLLHVLPVPANSLGERIA